MSSRDKRLDPVVRIGVQRCIAMHKGAAALVAFALSLPGAREDFPWGESVAKIGKKIFVFLGRDEKQRERGLRRKSVSIWASRAIW